MGEDWLVSAANIRVCSLSVAWLHASGLRHCCQLIMNALAISLALLAVDNT
jgi:hypothetical protein